MENKHETPVFKPGNPMKISRDYIDTILVEMRLIDADLPSTRMVLFGQEFETPVMTAALSHLGEFIGHEMSEMAEGANGAHAAMWTGMGVEQELESILATGAKTIKIIKPYADEGLIYRRLEHAQRTGALAVGMDIDHCFDKKGAYDHVMGYPMVPKTLKDIENYVKATDLPFIVKGVLSVEDAKKCVQAGVKGIVVSHHNGMIDYAVPPLMLLPKIVEAVGNDLEIFVDGGISSGMDVFKTLALGAKAVCVGAPLMASIRAGGAKGVTKSLRDMTIELATVMARTGAKDLKSISKDVLWLPK